MAYTLGEATKATGVSKTSLHRAIKSGRISATKNAAGVWEIDPAELHRVYPAAAPRNRPDSSALELVDQAGTVSETAVLRRELSLKDGERLRERTQLEATIADLREDRDRWRAQAERLLLTSRPRPRGWWRWVAAVLVLIVLLGSIAWFFVPQHPR
jgi:hypothetical protein